MRGTVCGSLALAVLAGTACHAMAPLTWEDITAQRPALVWVTRADRSIVPMSGPQVFGDTLVGYIGGAFHELPTAGIAQVVIKRSAKGKTMALVAASIAGATVLGIIVSSVGMPAESDRVNCPDEPDHPLCQGQGP